MQPHGETMRSRLKSLFNTLARVAAAPFAWTCLLDTHLLRDSEAIFQLWTHVFALLPGMPGVFLRRAFYSFTLKQCSLSCHIGFGSLICHREAVVEAQAYLGNYTILGSARIRSGSVLGSRVSVPSGKHVHQRRSDGTWGPMDRERMEPVDIGPDAWVGEGAVILASVAHGALVGAGSVVTEPVPANTVVGGNPARIIKTFS